jgi:hypothetical protein
MAGTRPEDDHSAMAPDEYRESVADEGAVTLLDVLDTVGDLGTTSRALFAWEFAWTEVSSHRSGTRRSEMGCSDRKHQSGATGERVCARSGPGQLPARTSAHRPSCVRH